MTISIGLVALCVLGALLYAFAPGKAAELGRLAFACALLALCFTMSRGSVRLGLGDREGRFLPDVLGT